MIDSLEIDYKKIKSLVSRETLKELETFRKLIIMRNNDINLISSTTIGASKDRHIVDSAQIIDFVDKNSYICTDLGSGAGLPGIILAIIGYKNLHLVEKSTKKSIFLEGCKSRLGLEYTVHNKSITDLNDLNIDYITARAFAPIEKIVSLTKKIIYKHTKFILLKGKSYLSEIQFINQNKYFWEAHSSLTSDESKIIVVGAK